MSPFLLLKIAIPFILVGLCGFAYHHAYQSGFDQATSLFEKKQLQATQAHNDKLNAERAGFQATMEELDQRYKGLHDVKLKNDAVLLSLQSKRLSIPARCPAHATESGNPAAASVGDDYGSAELEPAFAENIFRVTTDGDTAISQMNLRLQTCIDAYDAVRNLE